MVNKFDELLEQFGSSTESLNETVLVDKKFLEEQKRKAKAWDKYIAEVRERVKITVNTDDDIERETQKVINYFMEDE